MTQQDPFDTIEHLSPQDALTILKILARNDAEIATRIAEIARAHMRGVDLEEVAFAVYDELTFLGVEDVWYGAGPTRHGYVEPQESAYEMIEGVIDPYLDELKKYQRLGMDTEATQLCMGGCCWDVTGLSMKPIRSSRIGLPMPCTSIPKRLCGRGKAGRPARWTWSGPKLHR